MDLGRQQVKTTDDDRAYTIEEKIQLLKQVSTFKLISLDKLKVLASKLKTEYYKIGQKIIKQHTAGTKFYIISEGQCAVLKEETDSFGNLKEKIIGDVEKR